MRYLLLSMGMAAIFFPAAAPADFINAPYGICALVNRQPKLKMIASELKLMREAGIEWARTNIMWYRVESKAGRMAV